MSSNQRRLQFTITLKILLLVLSLAILLASFGGYAMYVINSIGLKTERLNKIESVLETQINSMNASLIKSSAFVTRSTLELGLAGSDQGTNFDAIEESQKKFNETIKTADKFSKEAYNDLQRAKTTINDIVKQAGSGKYRTKTIQQRLNELVEPPISAEAIKIYKKIVTALDAIEGNYRDIKRAQERIKKAVLTYNDFVTSTQLSPYSNPVSYTHLTLPTKA